MIKFKKIYTETYKMSGSSCLWASINLELYEKAVNVMISSDYGNFSYFWGSTGKNPKKFLTKISKDYTMKKFLGENMYEIDLEACRKSIKEIIIEERKMLNISKDEAFEAWIELDNIMNNYSMNENQYFTEITRTDIFDKIFYDWEAIPTHRKNKSIVDLFWNDLWIPFTEELKKELRHQ